MVAGIIETSFHQIMDIILNWTELKHISEIIYKDEYGVYIWGFMFEDDFIPYYVGIAYNITIPGRLTEHISNLAGGKYCIIHSSDLRYFYRFKDIVEPLDDHGLIYIPNWPEGFAAFLKKRYELKPHIDNMMDRMYFSYSLLGQEFQTKKDYESVEKACISSIGKEKLWNTRGGQANATIIKLSGDKRVTSIFR